MQLGIPSKDEMTLIQFQSMVANALSFAGKSTQPRRGRPSITHRLVKFSTICLALTAVS